jgi:hypothetical protein
MTPDTPDRNERSDWESVHVCPNCGHIINLALTDPRRVYEAEYWCRGFPPPAPFPFVGLRRLSDVVRVIGISRRLVDQPQRPGWGPRMLPDRGTFVITKHLRPSHRRQAPEFSSENHERTFRKSRRCPCTPICVVSN